MQIAVARRVVVVEIAREAQFAKEKLVEQIEPQQRFGILRNAPLQPRLQAVHFVQELLHIQARIFVLRDAGRRLQQRDGAALRHLDQRREILQRRGNGIAQRHAPSPFSGATAGAA